MVRLRVDKDFHGPSLVELHRSGLLTGNKVIEAAWAGSNAEMVILRDHTGPLCLVVPDLATLQRTAQLIGVSGPLPGEVVTQGDLVLNSRDESDWVAFYNASGPVVSRNLLTRIAADLIRGGVDPKKLRRVVDKCLLHGVSAREADVLLGLDVR